mmetsp:Transcript_8537/g.15603  ORF Transcript_8537/g.15603 Transcript_8537/m.15603 type:complete len:295 (+) Transcript_8537:33-917(+)
MAFLCSNVSANDILISSLLSAFTCSDLAHLEMVSASVLADLSATQHWVMYFEQSVSHIGLAGECLAALSESAPSRSRSHVKALLFKLTKMASSAPQQAPDLAQHVAPLALESLSDISKLAKKLEAAEEKARQARDNGFATTDALVRCFQFTGGSVSDPILFSFGAANSDSFLLQLGWTRSNDVVLKVTPRDPRPDGDHRCLFSISVSTIGSGPYFVSRDSIVTADQRWWSTNGICTTVLSGPDLLKSLFTGLWCVVCICHQPDDAPEPQSSRATRVLESLSLQRLDADMEPAFP